MKKFLNNFAGATVLSPAEQAQIKGAGFEISVCAERPNMACGSHIDCPMGCRCDPNEYGWTYCIDKPRP